MKTTTSYFKTAVFAALLLTGASQSRASVILDTYTGGGDGRGFYTLGSKGSAGLAISFSVASNVTIDSIKTGLQGIGTVNLIVETSSNGLPSGSPLYSLPLINPIADTTQTGLGWELSPGNYFLTETVNPSFVGSWTNVTNPTSFGWLFSITPNQWLTPPDFQANSPVTALITTSVVPVPAAAWLFGSGLLGLIGLRRKSA